MNLQGQVAIVTGASRGIGRVTALALAADGADVVCAARTTDAAPAKLPGTVEETARQVRALGQRALALPCDVSQQAEVDALVERTIAEFGRVHILINNAAVNYRAPFADTPIGRWDLLMNVNLRGPVLCTQAVLPHMLKQGGGRIVNLSSGAVTMPEVSAELGITAYAASKAALEMMTKVLGLELAASQIAVNCLRIESAVVTEGALFIDPEGDYSGWETPEAVAEAIVRLIEQPASYTGRVITIAEARELPIGG
ncbi:MAG: SDR family NAD(P)-dependent oxidoreductase [Dehalococcoidia bacterium]